MMNIINSEINKYLEAVKKRLKVEKEAIDKLNLINLSNEDKEGLLKLITILSKMVFESNMSQTELVKTCEIMLDSLTKSNNYDSMEIMARGKEANS